MRTSIVAFLGLILVCLAGCSSPKMHTVTVDDDLSQTLELRVGDNVLVRRNANTPAARLIHRTTDGNEALVLMPLRLGKGGNTLMLIYYEAVRRGTGTIEVQREDGTKKTLKVIVPHIRETAVSV